MFSELALQLSRRWAAAGWGGGWCPLPPSARSASSRWASIKAACVTVHQTQSVLAAAQTLTHVKTLTSLQAEMCSDSFQLLGMAQRGFLPAVLARRSQHGTPTVAIILSSLGVMALVRLPH